MTRLMKPFARTILLLALIAGAASSVQAQTLATYQLGSGWATFGVALPAGAATSGLAVGTLQTQTDVKTRWADGSIRFAVVTAKVPSAGTYAISAGPAASGTASATVPNASVRLQIGSTTYTAQAPAVSGDVWLSGPLVREWRGTVTPESSSGALHPFLRVIFDTRIYNDGQGRLDVTVENNLDVSGATSVTYTVNVVNDALTLYSKTSVVHPWLTRWRKVFGIGGLVTASVTPDFEPAAQAGALPRYLSTVNNTVDTPGGASFDILGVGALDPSMPDTGGRAELAPYPDWVARYVVHRQATQRQFVLAHGDLAGSWPIHLRESDGRLVSIIERPNFWLDGRCEPDGISCPRGNLGATGSLVPDKAHQPSLAYVPYLLTGDRYYADELAFWANYEFISTWPTERKGSTGLIYYYEIRGFAWTLRTLGDAAAYLPDGYPSKAFFVSKVATNLQWADDWADGKITFGRVAQTLHPLGISFYYDDGAGNLRVGEWENYYLAWSIDHLQQQGFSGGVKLRDRIVRLVLAGYTDPTFPRSCVFYYRPIVGFAPSQFFTSMSQFASQGACQDTRDLADAYWGMWQRPTLLIALTQGWAGAQTAYDYMMNYSSAYGTVVQRANEYAGWAMAPGGIQPPPPPPPGDTTPPVLGGVQSSAMTSSSEAIAWTTDEGADGQVQYGLTSSYGSTTPINAGLTTTHQMTLSGLQAATLYHYRVNSRDASGNLSTSGDFTFTTMTTTVATTLTVTFDDISGSQQTLPTDYPAGVLRWEAGKWFHSGPFGAFTTKSISFDGGTFPGMTSATVTILANYRLTRLDAFNGGVQSTVTLSCAGQLTRQVAVAAGQLIGIDTGWTGTCGGPVTIASSNGWDTNFDNIVLQAVSADTTPPAISALQATGITISAATITWTTDEASDSVVEYGTTTAYGSTVSNSAAVTAHRTSVLSLSASTTYHFRVKSTDAAGNTAVSPDQTFTTNAATAPAAPSNLRIVSP